ncbi:MAG: hypothetical protein CMM87_07190, partial [Rickettsiales bacterium]|nr:hypothetical protein [Rickettsiales bacterium]
PKHHSPTQRLGGTWIRINLGQRVTRGRGVPQPETLAVVLGNAEIVQAVGDLWIIIQHELADLLQQFA